MDGNYLNYLNLCNIKKQEKILVITRLIKDNIINVKYKIWRNTLIFYIEESKRIIIASYEDYCFIYANGNIKYKDEILRNYIMHPKGMIKLKDIDIINEELLIKIFKASL